METHIVASGRGIRPEVELDTVDNRSAALATANLFGIVLDAADGELFEVILL